MVVYDFEKWNRIISEISDDENEEDEKEIVKQQGDDKLDGKEGNPQIHVGGRIGTSVDASYGSNVNNDGHGKGVVELDEVTWTDEGNYIQIEVIVIILNSNDFSHILFLLITY